MQVERDIFHLVKLTEECIGQRLQFGRRAVSPRRPASRSDMERVLQATRSWSSHKSTLGCRVLAVQQRIRYLWEKVYREAADPKLSRRTKGKALACHSDRRNLKVATGPQNMRSHGRHGQFVVVDFSIKRLLNNLALKLAACYHKKGKRVVLYDEVWMERRG